MSFFAFATSPLAHGYRAHVPLLEERIERGLLDAHAAHFEPLVVQGVRGIGRVGDIAAGAPVHDVLGVRGILCVLGILGILRFRIFGILRVRVELLARLLRLGGIGRVEVDVGERIFVDLLDELTLCACAPGEPEAQREEEGCGARTAHVDETGHSPMRLSRRPARRTLTAPVSRASATARLRVVAGVPARR